MEDNIKIFSGNANRALSEEICRMIELPLGDATVTTFPDGESFVKINENVRGKDVFIIQPTCPPTNHHLVELLIMIDAARRASAQRITAVLPFYGYARQDRKDQPRVPITAKLVANLLVASGANRVLTMDLHSQQIQGFFDIPVDHLYASPVFFEYLAKNLKTDRLVVVSPDVGGMKMAAAYAEVLGAGLGMVAKKRTSSTTVEAISVVGEVKGADVLLVDDITETAGTLTAAARILREQGALSVRAAVSHCILNEMAYQRLQAGLIDELITTNSVPLDTRGLPITRLSIAGLLGEAILRIHSNRSVTGLLRSKVSEPAVGPPPMNRRAAIPVLLLAAAAAFVLWGEEKRGTVSPALQVDRTPLAEAGRGPVSYADALEIARPAVVSVYSTRFARQRGNPAHPITDLRRNPGGGSGSPQPAGPERGLGSGVIVSADGLVLTNNHVVEGADEMLVKLPDGREIRARLIGADPKTDVAVLKIEADRLPSITLGDSDQLRVGDVVFALGNPLGVGQTATMGIVSATGRRGLDLLTRGDGDPGYEDFIQTDAAINVGNSGGALVDARGRLVGINTAILTTSRGNIGIGFSIPVNLASFVMKSLLETGTVVRGYLGVSTEDLDPATAEKFGLKEMRGVLVTEVVAGSPAAAAGLRKDDVILAINGRPVGNRDEIRLVVSQMPPGSKIELRYLRQGKPGSLEAVLALLDDRDAIPAAAPVEWIEGVRIARLTDAIRREYGIDEALKGVVIIGVEPRSRFAHRFQPGMVVEQVNRRDVSDLETAKTALRKGANAISVRFSGLRQSLPIELP